LPQTELANKDVVAELKSLIIGQDAALDELAPYLKISMSGLSPEGRPAGVFLLLGPSGVGKTQTVHNLAKIVHGSDKNVLRIDCGEYQLDHEVAKLIGAPPGYLGHRETHAVLSMARVTSVTSEASPLSIILFDEIEKAAPSFDRILLGLLDRGQLKLGDNTVVNFENSLIFMTSNLGSAEMNRLATNRHLGLPTDADHTIRKEKAGMSAARKRFSPEFMGRIDGVVTYKTLSLKDTERILDMQLEELQTHLDKRLGVASPKMTLTKAARKLILERGYSKEYGVRDLKRCIQTNILAPVADLVFNKKAKASVTIGVERGEIVVVSEKLISMEGA
jgi:ATP-dependent Clp protease ATP-binding subunit ClpA